jgi:hypothetical protein
MCRPMVAPILSTIVLLDIPSEGQCSRVELGEGAHFLPLLPSLNRQRPGSRGPGLNDVTRAASTL